MENDEFTGQGGSYLMDGTGLRIRLLPEWETALPTFSHQPDMIAALVEETSSTIQASLPALPQAALLRLQELEQAGKQRITVLDAISAALS
jgi:hypothetical protein